MLCLKVLLTLKYGVNLNVRRFVTVGLWYARCLRLVTNGFPLFVTLGWPVNTLVIILMVDVSRSSILLCRWLLHLLLVRLVALILRRLRCLCGLLRRCRRRRIRLRRPLDRA